MDTTQEDKDQNVVSFMMQLVQEKYGDDIELDFLNSESERLYEDFGNNLVSYFEPMLSEEQKKEFDQIVSNGSQQDELLNYLLEAIPNLEEQILQVLVTYRASYLQKEKTQ